MTAYRATSRAEAADEEAATADWNRAAKGRRSEIVV
jgi:hypothetical protein